MLVTNRFVVDVDAADGFTERAHAALTALAARPGYLRGQLVRALDDPRHWSWSPSGSRSARTGGRWAPSRSRSAPRRCSPSRSTSPPRTSRWPAAAPAGPWSSPRVIGPRVLTAEPSRTLRCSYDRTPPRHPVPGWLRRSPRRPPRAAGRGSGSASASARSPWCSAAAAAAAPSSAWPSAASRRSERAGPHASPATTTRRWSSGTTARAYDQLCDDAQRRESRPEFERRGRRRAAGHRVPGG